MRSPLSFRRNEDGASLIEFSLVALPLLLLLMGTIEAGFVYWGRKELESATSAGARLVRTGQAQASGWTSSDLRTEICKRTALLYDCASKLRVDVASAASFTAFAAVDPVDGNGTLKDDGSFAYAPGGRNDVVLVRTFYPWTGLLGSYVFRAAAPGRNEPF
ncbi:MAG: TadE/TadG family type IV pilus assembly protein [Hyphomicrobiaceae bacterium]|nr:TadE/TadG family type IV pilus assembly protein [Hyphomicrobiaceae bacterium]